MQSTTNLYASALTTGLVLNTIGSPFATYAGTSPCSVGQAITSIDASGVGSCTAFSTSAFPFTQQTQYGLNTSATTTLMQLTN